MRISERYDMSIALDKSRVKEKGEEILGGWVPSVSPQSAENGEFPSRSKG